MYYRVDLLPSRQFWADEETHVDLTDNWESVIESMNTYVKTSHVPVLKEHELAGGDYGKVMSVYQSPEDPNRIKADILIESPVLKDELSGKSDKQYRFVSPRIRWNFKDIAGEDWLAALLELSLVSIPRITGTRHQDPIRPILQDEVMLSESTDVNIEKVTDTDEDALIRSIEIQLSEKYSTPTYYANLEPIQEIIMENSMLTPEMKDEMLKMFKDLMISHMESMNAEKEKELVEEREEEEKVTGDEDMMSEMPNGDMVDYKGLYEAVLAELESLKNERSMMEEESMMSQVRKDLQARNMDLGKAKAFVTLYKTDKTSYETAMSAIGVKSATATVGVSTNMANVEPKSATARALEIQAKEGLTFKNALKKAVAEG